MATKKNVKTNHSQYRELVTALCAETGLKSNDIVFTGFAALDIRGVTFTAKTHQDCFVVIPQKAFDRLCRIHDQTQDDAIHAQTYVTIMLPDDTRFFVHGPVNDNKVDFVDGFAVESMRSTYYEFVRYCRNVDLEQTRMDLLPVLADAIGE